MFYLVIIVLASSAAQIFDNTNESPAAFIQVERNGVSQFNSGPLPLSISKATPRNNPLKKNNSKKIYVQASTSVENRSGKALNQNKGARLNHRTLPTSGSRLRNNSVPKITIEAEPSAEVAAAGRNRQNAFRVQSEQGQFENDYDEETGHDSEAGFAKAENRTFQDMIMAGNFAVESQPLQPYINGHSEYVYPEKQHPLKNCFYNPSGYACCNRALNDEIVRTYEQLARETNFNPCNIQKIANAIQRNCARRFNLDFEALVGLSDYAQRVNFRRDLVCKVELAGRYMLAYATPQHDARGKRGGEPEANQSIDEIVGLSTSHSLSM